MLSSLEIHKPEEQLHRRVGELGMEIIELEELDISRQNVDKPWQEWVDKETQMYEEAQNCKKLKEIFGSGSEKFNFDNFFSQKSIISKKTNYILSGVMTLSCRSKWGKNKNMDREEYQIQIWELE